MRFENKIVVITGGAGGVGQALVRLFAAEGARLMISDINAEGCQAMVDEARALGAEAECLAGNLREKEYCEAIIVRAVEAGRPHQPERGQWSYSPPLKAGANPDSAPRQNPDSLGSEGR